MIYIPVRSARQPCCRILQSVGGAFTTRSLDRLGGYFVLFVERCEHYADVSHLRSGVCSYRRPQFILHQRRRRPSHSTRPKNYFGLATSLDASRVSMAPSCSHIRLSGEDMAPYANCCSMTKVSLHWAKTVCIWQPDGALQYGILRMDFEESIRRED